MMYFKTIDGKRIVSLEERNTRNSNATEITQEEYERIQEMIRNKPIAPEGYAYRLTDDLEWELYELPEEEESDLTAEEALEIILGGAV